MSILGYIGSGTRSRLSRAARTTAVVGAVCVQSVRPSRWTAPMRNVLARQILFTGLEASGFVSLIAVIVGVLVVVQAQYWLTRLGQTALIGPILAAVVLRELGPLLTNFVVIARSGTAISTELANMKVHGEVRALDAMGIDPFVYLVIPRVLGVAASTFCLTILFLAVTFLGGFACMWVIKLGDLDMGLFFGNIIGAVTVTDVFSLLAKSILPGMLTGAICCDEALAVGTAVTDVPIAATRGVMRSIGALFIMSLLISMMAYL
ncbi:MAG: ABC transporter permease [Lentisphaerae bacterium]|nr:ABC transporter permease [Lentisphaerota bacterium]